jgi:hypothetical protein
MTRLYSLDAEPLAMDVRALLSAIGYFAWIWRGARDTVKLETNAPEDAMLRAEALAVAAWL